MAEAGRTSTVADIMSTPVMTASSSETIADAAARMRENKVGSLVVVDGERPVGILTERDLVRFAASGAEAAATKVSEWMTPDPDTVHPSLTPSDALRNLAEKGYRHIPVVEDGELKGIVSMRDLMKIAEIRPVGILAIDVPKGLKGVVVAETEIGDVRGLEGFYHYRQYSAVELAEKRTLEDVWHLLYEGYLPESIEERQKFIDEIHPFRIIPAPVKKLLPDIAAAGGQFVPLEALRTAYSYVAATLNFKSWLDIDREEMRSNALQTCAVIPTLIMALYRLNHGMQPVEPRPDLPYAANYLYMMTGEDPDPVSARAIEQYLMLTIDHGFNASTFTGRVITSTGADIGSAVVGAIGALSGPLHGGAPSRALDMLDEIGVPEKADDWIRSKIDQGQRLMGFGHAVYKTDDPRSIMLRGIAESFGGPKVELAKHIERRAVALLNELKPGRQLYTNVEFYAAVVLEHIGLPNDLFTPTFASSRVIGWTAHMLEQASDNRIIRPSARYVGPPPPEPVPTI